MKKILMIFIIGMFLISLVSSLEIDNSKRTMELNKDGNLEIGNRNIEYNSLWEKYPPIQIKNLWGYGKEYQEMTLTEHSEFTCENDYCYSKGILYTSGDYAVYDKLNFYTKQDDGSWKKQDVRSWKFQYFGNIDDYEYQCTDTGKVNINGTSIQECNNVQVGSHQGWIKLDVGEKLPEGTYDYFLEARKKPSREVDYRFVVAGKEIEDHAVWGAVIGVGGVEASVTLNSPSNGATVYSTNNLFNASATVTGGAYLKNMSLWTNNSGSWTIANTTTISGTPTIQTEDAHGISFGSSGSSGAEQGMGIKVGATPFYVISAKGTAGMTATDCTIRNGASERIANGTFVDGICEFTTYPLLSASTIYTIQATSGGASFTRKYTTSASYPVNEVDFQWWQGVGQGATEGFNIDSINHTTTLVGDTSATETWNLTIDGPTGWYVTAGDSDGDVGQSETRVVSLDSTAPTIEINAGNGTQDYGSLTTNHTINLTVTDDNLDKVWINYNGTNTTITGVVSGVLNSTSFPIVKDLYTATIYANDTVGNVQSQVVSWDYKVFENSRTYQENVFETSSQTFTLNITTDEPTSTSIFYYNGESKTVVKTTGDDLIFTSTFDIPTISTTSNRSLYWQINYDGETINTYNSSQIVTDWNMSFNNTKQLINVTIYDEETLEIVNSTTLGILANNWLGTGTYNISFSNSTELDGIFNIGVSDSGINNLNSDIWLYYSATGYQQRNFYETYLLSNSSVQQIDLYLLLADAGILNIYSVTSNSGLFEVEDALVRAYKIEGATETLVDSALTDSSGQSLLFLDPDFLHKIVVTKSGCTTLEKNQYPTGGTTDLPLTCGEETGIEINQSIYEGLTVDFTPTNIQITNGSTEFKVDINDENCYLDSYNFYLRINGATVNSTSGTNPCGEELSLYYNPTSGEITSYILITKNDSSIVRTKTYYVTNTGNLTDMGDSLWEILLDFQDQEFFGLSDTSKMFIAFIIIFLMIGFLSSVEGIKSEGVGTLIFTEIMVIIFSLIGWLDLGILPNTTIYSWFLNKFAIAILGLFLLLGILLLKSER